MVGRWLQRVLVFCGPWTLLILLHLRSCIAVAIAQEQINCNRPPLDVHPKDCCHLPSLIDEDLLRNCKSLYGGEQLQRKLIYERGKCFVECALNATGTMVNRQLDQSKILAVIETATRDDTLLMQLLLTNTVQCIEQVSASANDDAGQACSSRGVDFVSCMNIRNFLNCPQHFWTNTDQCNRLKMYIQQCPRPI